jgi:hypothetical protein
VNSRQRTDKSRTTKDENEGFMTVGFGVRRTKWVER